MKILLTGGSGMVGSAIKKLLEGRSEFTINCPTSKEMNLLDSKIVSEYFGEFQPDVLIHCAAKVGGVWSNSNFPATFSLDNLTMQTNVANAIVKHKIKKTINLSSSCIYPKDAVIPLSPKSLMSGPLESTNRWYAMAKLSMISALEGIKIQHGLKSVSILPTNIYGPNDNFHTRDGHVIASLLIRAIEMKKSNSDFFNVWGTGKAMREVIYVDDLARAVLMVLDKFEFVSAILNVGSGQEFSIKEIANKILKTVGHYPKIIFDTTMPDGVLRKPLDSAEIRALGWIPEIDFDTGLKLTHDWILKNFDDLRMVGVGSND